jgi:parallel beta-helix repeat protein
LAREQDIIHLFKNLDVKDPEMLQIALAKNFAEIENRLGIVQMCLKQISGGSVTDVTAKLQQSFADTAAALIAASQALETADGNIQGFFQDDTPSEGMNFGDIWIDTDGHSPLTTEDIYRYEDEEGGSAGELSWASAPTSAVGIVYLEAYNAQLTAGKKITTFYQSDIPVAESKGDLWVDIDDNNKTYRAAAAGADTIIPGEWEPIRDLGVTRSAATYVISDGSTTNVSRHADYIIPSGSTSAQKTIQKAIDALPADGGKILFLEGTYIVDGPINLRDHVVLEGQGQNTILKLKDNCAYATPSFTRNSIAFGSNGEDYGSGLPRYKKAKFGKGILIEEGATNLLSANQSSVETDTTGLSTLEITTISRVTTEYWHGSASLKVVTSGTSPSGHEGMNTQSVVVSPGVAYTASAYVKGTGTVRINLNERTSADAWAKDNFGPIITLTDSWQRLTISATMESTTARASVRVVTSDRTQAATFYVDGLQLEQKAYATSWQIGGTPRAAEVLTVPATDIFNKGNWTMEVIYTPTIEPANGLYKTFLDITIDSNNFYRLTCDPAGRLGFHQRTNGGTVVAQGQSVLTKGIPYSIAVTSDGSVINLYVNGVLEGSTAYTEPSGTPSIIGIGAVSLGVQTCNGIIDDLRISNRARTLEEHQEYVSSNKPHVYDDATTLILNFDNNIGQFNGIIQNEDVTDGNDYISILSLEIDGNKNNNPSCSVDNIHMFRTYGGIIAYCDITDSCYHGIFITKNSDKFQILNNHVYRSERHGIYTQGCSDNIISGNISEQNVITGIILYDYVAENIVCDENSVTGNICRRNGGSGLVVHNGRNNIISNNTCYANDESGIRSSGTDHTSICSNTCKANAMHGMYLSSSEDSIVSSNSCISNSQEQSGMYCGIYLSSSSYNNVQGNLIRGSIHKYGIDVHDSGCVGNIVTNNDLRVSGSTGKINDAGTGTITTAGNKV